MIWTHTPTKRNSLTIHTSYLKLLASDFWSIAKFPSGGPPFLTLMLIDAQVLVFGEAKDTNKLFLLCDYTDEDVQNLAKEIACNAGVFWRARLRV